MIKTALPKLRPSQGFGGTSEHAHLFSGNKGLLILANVLKEQSSKTNFREQGTLKCRKIAFREQRDMAEYLQGT